MAVVDDGVAAPLSAGGGVCGVVGLALGVLEVAVAVPVPAGGVAAPVSAGGAVCGLEGLAVDGAEDAVAVLVLVDGVAAPVSAGGAVCGVVGLALDVAEDAVALLVLVDEGAAPAPCFRAAAVEVRVPVAGFDVSGPDAGPVLSPGVSPVAALSLGAGFAAPFFC